MRRERKRWGEQQPSDALSDGADAEEGYPELSSLEMHTRGEELSTGGEDGISVSPQRCGHTLIHTWRGANYITVRERNLVPN